jgi:hypothetical protein
LVLARLLIAVGSLDGHLESAKREALSACTGVESMGSAMASMPHYMSQGVNELTASGVERAVNALMSMLLLTVTGVEELVVFFINAITQTFICLVTLAVRGSVELALNIAKEATEFIDKAAGEIGDDIGEGVKGFEETLNGFLGGIGSLTSAFGGGLDVPKLDFSGAVNRLNDLKLPGSINENIDKVSDSLPTFDQVNNFTNNALRFPFEKVKQLINESIDDFVFDRAVLPVPPRERLSFCSDDDGINGFFDSLAVVISKAKNIFVGVLIAAAILACAPMGWREIQRWRQMKERSLLVQKNAHDPMDVVYIVSRPYTSKVGLKLASWVKPGRRQVLIRWVIAYATSPQALFLISLGVAGLFSCACQMVLLNAVKKEVPALTGQVSQFADKVVRSLNNASEQWAVSTNGVIDSANEDINQKVFGWVNTTTTSMNDTLNIFVETTSDILEKAFGGTILHEPVKEVINCVIGLKIKGVQRGLTWVQEHAHVNFPNMPNDTFSLGAIASIAKDNDTNPETFLANPGDETADAISAAVVRVTRAVESGIRTEAIISSFLIAIWFFVLFCALMRALTLAWRHDKTRGEGGADAVYHQPTLPTDADRAEAGQMTAGFHDVPLTAVGAVPRYSTAPHIPGKASSHGSSQSDEYYQAQKLGYAGQRALNDQGIMHAHVRKSSYGELEYGSDAKRG